MALHGKHGDLKRRGNMLIKEQLTAMGLTEEQADKVLTTQKAAIDSNFVTKGRFNDVNAELKQLRFDIALNAALAGAKARNPETVKPLLKTFLEKAELDGDGSIISIHTPRVGSDAAQKWTGLLSFSFQSTLPAWGATVRRA